MVLPTLSSGGAESFIASLSIELAKKHNKVFLFLLAGITDSRGQYLHDELEKAGVKILNKKARSARSIFNFFSLVFSLYKYKPSIVLSNLYSSDFYTAIASKFPFNKKIIFTRRMASSKIDTAKNLNIVKFIFKSFDLHISCSASVDRAFQILLKNVGIETNQVNTAVIENGVLVPDEHFFINVATRAKHGFNIPEDSFVIAHVGRMEVGKSDTSGSLTSSPKAHDVILKTFAQVQKNHKNTVLLLIGDGFLRKELELLAHKLGIQQYVRFAGALSQPWEALAIANLFFFPSRYEGLPNALIEAACAGLPAVVSDIAEIKNVHHGQAWRVAKVDDELAFTDQIQKAISEYAVLSVQAQQDAEIYNEKYSISACAENYRRCFEQVYHQ